MRSWELQNWYFSKSWLLTRLCRQAVLTAVHVYVCYTGGGSLASSLSSDTDSRWDFSESLCLSGASVFSSVKQDSWILVGAGQGLLRTPIHPDHVLQSSWPPPSPLKELHFYLSPTMSLTQDLLCPKGSAASENQWSKAISE